VRGLAKDVAVTAVSGAKERPSRGLAGAGFRYRQAGQRVSLSKQSHS
jgi:hypothetical protein